MATVKAPAIPECLRLVQTEYLELPALHMTKPQIRRRWGFDAGTCDEVVEALVHTHFLKADHGQYVRDDFVGCEWSPRD